VTLSLPETEQNPFELENQLFPSLPDQAAILITFLFHGKAVCQVKTYIVNDFESIGGNVDEISSIRRSATAKLDLKLIIR
jgi:hypothetical protein